MKITNENDAWDLFERLQRGETVDAKDVKFEGWPQITIKVTSGDASISSEMMEAFLWYQDMIYRSAGLIIRGKGDLRNQSLLEKEALEIRVKVTKGSTIGSIDLTDVIKSIGNEAVKNMDSTELMILLIGAGLLWTGNSVYRVYMNGKLKEKELEAKEKDRESYQTQQLQMSKEETKRARLMASAMHKSAIVAQIDEISEEAAIELFEIASTEGETKVAGVAVTEKIADLITKRRRRTSDTENIEATFKINKMDGTLEDGFKAQLENVETGKVFTAGLTNTLLSEDAEKKLFSAFEDKKEIKLNVSVKTLEGEVSSAEVVSVL